jgi:hypothetical protein
MSTIENLFFVFVMKGTGTPSHVIVYCHDTVKKKRELFSETQLEYFESENVDIVTSGNMIYKEDSVATIRRKIMDEIGGGEEVYLFTECQKDVTQAWMSRFHENMSRPKMLESSLEFGVDLSNVVAYSTMEQWRGALTAPLQHVFVPLGHGEWNRMVANPFSVFVSNNSAPLQQQQQESRFLEYSTTSTYIYACPQSAVHEYARANNLGPEFVLTYFPKGKYKPRTTSSDDDEETLYDIHVVGKEETTMRTVRILENVTCTWTFPQQQTDSTWLPLESIMKRFHASDAVPCIVYLKPGQEPLFRLYKPSAASWMKTSPTKGTKAVRCLQFHLKSGAVITLHAQYQVTFFLPRASSFDEIKNTNFFEPLVSVFPKDMLKSRSLLDMNPWQQFCSFQYSVALPSTHNFVKTKLPRPYDFLREFDMNLDTTRTIILRNVTMLEYVPILDLYLDALVRNHTVNAAAASSFWTPPPEEEADDEDHDEAEDDEDDEDDQEEATDKTNNEPPLWFQRPSEQSGFEVLESPAVAPSASEYTAADGDVVPAAILSMLGSKEWKPAQAHDFDFLTAMAYLYSKQTMRRGGVQPREFRKIMAESLTLDRFLRYHNGNLPAMFRSKNKPTGDVEPYKTTEFAKTLDLNDEHQLELLEQTVQSYETFLDVLQSSDTLDYTYLWDMMTDVNPDLMPRGMNLVILQMQHGRAQLVCPTNAYSSFPRLDVNKETAFLFRRTLNEYVPLERGGTPFTRNVGPRIPSLAQQCLSSPSLQTYTFRSNLLSTEMRRLLEDLKAYEVSNTIVRGNKVVALLVKGHDVNQQPVYVPCLPTEEAADATNHSSGKTTYVPLSYEITRDRLRGIAYASQGRIPCKPSHKVSKNGILLGLVTEANSFVPVVSTKDDDNHDDGLSTVTDFPEEEESIGQEHVEEDAESKALRLENQFYHMYQTLVRQQLTPEKREMWKKQLQSVTISYQNKIQFFQSEIRNLIQTHFQRMDPRVLDEVMHVCAPGDDGPYCLQNGTNGTNGETETIFPKFNLVDPSVNNELMYPLRLADELVRVRRQQLSMLYDEDGGPSSHVEYSIRDDEMVVTQSRIPALVKQLSNNNNNNNNATTTTWDTATPDRATLSPVDIMDAVEYVQQCIVDADRRITGFWKKVFPKTTTETVFQQSNMMKQQSSCAFAPLMYLNQVNHGTPITESSVRNVLWTAFETMLSSDTDRDTVLELLEVKTVEDAKQRVLHAPEYTLSDVDWWVFCQQRRIPAFLIWPPPPTTSSEQKGTTAAAAAAAAAMPWLRLYSEPAETTAYYFISKKKKNYSIITKSFALSALDTSALRDEQGKLVVQEI